MLCRRHYAISFLINALEIRTPRHSFVFRPCSVETVFSVSFSMAFVTHIFAATFISPWTHDAVHWCIILYWRPQQTIWKPFPFVTFLVLSLPLINGGYIHFELWCIYWRSVCVCVSAPCRTANEWQGKSLKWNDGMSLIGLSVRLMRLCVCACLCDIDKRVMHMLSAGVTETKKWPTTCVKMFMKTAVSDCVYSEDGLCQCAELLCC